MRIQMLPSTIDPDGKVSLRQHLLSIVVDDRVAIDAGCLAFSCSDLQRDQVRDIVLTHTHLDHIAGLPMFVDDLFSSLKSPIRVHATPEMIEILERDIFNWAVYPRFSELKNHDGNVLEYREFSRGSTVHIGDLSLQSIPVNHQVSACGYIVSDGEVSVGITGDTAETDDFWQICSETSDLAAVFVECAFPDELSELARVSCHLTPARLKTELGKFAERKCPAYVINIKPTFRTQVMEELAKADIPNLEILEIGRIYDF